MIVMVIMFLALYYNLYIYKFVLFPSCKPLVKGFIDFHYLFES